MCVCVCVCVCDVFVIVSQSRYGCADGLVSQLLLDGFYPTCIVSSGWLASAIKAVGGAAGRDPKTNERSDIFLGGKAGAESTA